MKVAEKGYTIVVLCVLNMRIAKTPVKKNLEDAWLVWERKQSAREKAIADITQLIEDVHRMERKLRDML